MSAFYVVAYGAISVPAILAGVLVTPLGLNTTFEVFGSVVALIALVVSFEAWRTRPRMSARPVVPRSIARLDLNDTTVLKAGNTFAVTRRDGSVPASGDHPLGFYRDDCRYVCGHELRGEVVARRIVGPGEIEEELHGRRAAARGGLPERARAARAWRTSCGVRRRRGSRRPGATAVTRALVVRASDGVFEEGVLRFSGAVRVRYSLVDPTAAAGAVRGRAYPSVTTDDERFNALLGRALDDLRLLESSLDGRAYYAAGLPWYATLFGRDSLITAFMMLAFDPDVARDTLRLLAARLGTEVDPAREEEPGKVLHELRVGEGALTPFGRYYGTVDATPLALCLLAEHRAWAGEPALAAEPVAAMRGWIGDGLLTYAPSGPGALRHQGWKDSDDGVPPSTRRVAPGRAPGLRARARRSELIERFWLPERGFYAMALGTDVLASNQGHLLWAGAVTPERARAIRDALMSERSFSGWGIRTLAEGEPGYDPLSYHNGTVWPHDTALIAAGLRRYGFAADFTTLFGGLLDAAGGRGRPPPPGAVRRPPRGDGRPAGILRRAPAAPRRGPRERSPTCSPPASASPRTRRTGDSPSPPRSSPRA